MARYTSRFILNGDFEIRINGMNRTVASASGGTGVHYYPKLALRRVSDDVVTAFVGWRWQGNSGINGLNYGVSETLTFSSDNFRGLRIRRVSGIFDYSWTLTDGSPAIVILLIEHGLELQQLMIQFI